MRLPSEPQKICPGVFYMMKPSYSLTARWYGYPFLAWKWAHNNYVFPWWDYPKLLLLIMWHSFLYWVKGGKEGHGR